ncbi:MAG: fibronectin type III domain-containing protein, partial [Thermoanaerobaculia bacterium]
IPPELGDLSSLYSLKLTLNQLSGSIPPELGDLSTLVNLHLHLNQLTGSIPAALGKLALLQQMYLYSNKLRGDIPAELEDLTALLDGSGLRMKWNALHSDNATLIAFLDGKSPGGEWQSTQTIAPTNLTFDRVGDHTVWLSWDAVNYLIDPGGYEVFSSPTGTGVWTSSGWTESKTNVTYPVTGLDPGTIYDFAVATYTDPHNDNPNLLHSDFSLQVTATTASDGCAQPIIKITGVDPITLSLIRSYDSYLWSTGETDPSIDVDPPFGQWYWVTVTSAGPCEETASTWVEPGMTIVTDGFESGDTSAWSSTVP